MKKLFTLLLIVTSFACSSDDDSGNQNQDSNNELSGLIKFQDTSWKMESEEGDKVYVSIETTVINETEDTVTIYPYVVQFRDSDNPEANINLYFDEITLDSGEEATLFKNITDGYIYKNRFLRGIDEIFYDEEETEFTGRNLYGHFD